MSIFAKIMLVWFAAQTAFALFLMFGARELPWHRRAIAAFGSVGMGLSLAALLFAPTPPAGYDGKGLSDWQAILLFAINLSLTIKLILYFRRGETSFSCLGTIGRAIGCVAVAWGMFALAMLSIAALWAVVIAIS